MKAQEYPIKCGLSGNGTAPLVNARPSHWTWRAEHVIRKPRPQRSTPHKQRAKTAQVIPTFTF